jgi:HSP20 family molecular chaperone IbpA
MFNKKTCKNCGEKVSSKNNFCPECGYAMNENKKDVGYGMLGKNDMPEEFQEFNKISNSMFSGFSGKIMSKMINSTMKMLEKEMEKSMKETEKQNQKPNSIKRNHFELYINGKRVNPENIKITSKPLIMNQNGPSPKKIQKKIPNRFLGNENIKTFSKLKKEEPKTNLKRLSDKIIYEISIPGVDSINDVSIVKLENSIEIKAISKSKNKAYSKIIPVNLNISGYNLDNETLIIELSDSQNL